MPNVIEGDFQARGRRFAIVASRFNDLFADRLVDGAVDTLLRHGADDGAITVVRCPGAFEVPQVARKVAETGRYDAILCLGVLIRGSTPHFDYISGEATSGVGSVAYATGIPVAYGILTCDTLEQAMERSGSKAGNKGAEAAMAAIEMASLYQKLGQSE